jgi:HEAT repeat protein
MGAAAHPFEELWQRFDDLDEQARREAGAVLMGNETALLQQLAAKLVSPEPQDRAKGLRVVRAFGLGERLAEQVYRLVNDADAVVRSVAVALLGELGGATARRILRRCLDDPDPRVQANAIEAIDRLEVSAREEQLVRKLGAEHHRVRATAVAALLKMKVHQAGEVLLDMLENPARAQRIAALWVVERLELGSLLHRLEYLARRDPDLQVRRRASRVLRSTSAWSLPLEPVSTPEGE